MPIIYKTGNGATLTLTGDLLAAFGEGWIATIVDLDVEALEIGIRSVAVLSDTDYDIQAPQDLSAPPAITGTLNFRADLPLPILKATGTASISYPGPDGFNPGIFAGEAFFRRFKPPAAANNETLRSEFTIQFTGVDLSWTPGDEIT